MNDHEIIGKMKTAQELVNQLSSELEATNNGLIALTLELEQRIDERNVALNALRESEEKFRGLFEDSKDTIFISTLEGRFLQINQAGLNLFGYSMDEIRLLKMENFYSDPSDMKVFQDKIGIKGSVRDFDVKLKKKDGSDLYCVLSVTLRNSKNGTILGYQGIIHDTTKRKEAERDLAKEHSMLVETNKELLKAHEQEAALRDQLVKAERLVSIGEMAAKIAHEINNPLTVIMGQAQLQLMSIEDDEVKNSFDLIFKNAEEVSQLTRRYMDLGKPVDTKLEPINLGEVLKNTVKSLSALGQLKKIKLSEKYLDEEQKVLGNQHMMEQVFRNLIINAIQASFESKDAEILIGTRLGKEGRVVEAYVSDKGVGIKAEDVGKIFDYYYTTKEEGTGSGLGLVICKEIVETTHGGRIDVLSSQGAGATFTVELPILEYSLQKKKIMIVDDEAYITELFGTYLSRMGFLIQTCNRAEEALRIYPDFMPDLVLSDYSMPEMTGLELYKKIKEIKDDQPFVMITGAFLSLEDLKYLREQKIPQLIKPANLETELLETVKQQLEKE